MPMTRDDIKTMIAHDPELVCDLIFKLLTRIEQLEQRLAKDSHNSSKPPSRDALKRPNKTRSLREKSNKKSGGQTGHNGSHLKMVTTPDHIITHPLDGACACGRSLAPIVPSSYNKRQVFDLPPLKIEVTEHRAEVKQCVCGKKHVADFPDGVNSPTQYGPLIKSYIIYLMVYQHLPYERTVELIDDMFHHTLSQGTLYNMYQACYDGLEQTDRMIKEQLINSKVAHFDETGSAVNKQNHWIHTASTTDFTYYACHEKRGAQAITAIGILPEYKGTAVHDFWNSYFIYECKHALCNEHHLRNLTYIHEQYQQSWAQDLIKLLLDIKKTVAEHKPHHDCLSQQMLQQFETRYQQIVNSGYDANPPPDEQSSKPKRGRKKRSEPLKLLDRFHDYRNEILAFMYDFHIPFDNNLAERDLRMMKLHLKISGQFRAPLAAAMFCRIRSYISSVKKHNINVLDSLIDLFNGNPVFLLGT
jgi:transposase